jgi:hypothetical protein
MSGFGSEEDIRLSLAAGFAVHLTKPIDVGRLDEAIRASSRPSRRPPADRPGRVPGGPRPRALVEGTEARAIGPRGAFPVPAEGKGRGRDWIRRRALLGGLAQLLAGAGQDGADGVLGDAELLADLAVVQERQVIEPDDFRLALGQVLEHAPDLLGGGDRLGLVGGLVGESLAVGRRVAQLGLAVPLDQLLDADPARHDRQVGRQRAGALEAAEHAVVVVDEGQEDLRGDVLDVRRGERLAAGVGGVPDDVIDQAHVPIDEVVPGPRLVPQAAVDQMAVDVAQRHGQDSPGGHRRRSRPGSDPPWRHGSDGVLCIPNSTPPIGLRKRAGGAPRRAGSGSARIAVPADGPGG